MGVIISGGSTGGAISGPEGATGYTARDIARNSLVHPDVSAAEWARVNYPKNAPYNANTSDGYQDAVHANFDRLSTGRGQYLHRIIIPPGWTQIAIDVPLQYVADDARINIGFYDSTLTTLVASQDVTITSTMTAYTVPATVTPGLMYFACIEVNHHNVQAHPIIGPVQVRWVAGTGTGVFASDFYRVRSTPANLHFNHGHKYVSNDYFTCTPLSELKIETNAPLIASEMWQQGPGGGVNTVACLVEGRRFTSSPNHTDNALWLDSFPLPNDGADHTVSIRNGYQSEWQPFISNYLSCVRAVFVPATARLELLRPKATIRTLSVLGDSIFQGAITADNNVTQGVSSLVRQIFPGDSIFECCGNRNLFSYANTVALRQQTARLLARDNPSTLIITLGTNDYASAPWTAAAFGTAYAAFLDEFHALCPRTDVLCFAPIPRTSEGANALGDTTGAFRTQIPTACSTRAPWATYIDTTTGVFAGLLALLTGDGVHLTDRGQSLFLYGTRTTLGIA